MPLVSPVAIFSALGALVLIGLMIGYPISRYFESERALRLMIAPTLGLALYGVLALLVFQLARFTSLNSIIVFAGIAALSWTTIAVWKPTQPTSEIAFEISTGHAILWVLVAIGISLIPALATYPHAFGNSVALTDVVFDHAKIAISDEIRRNGLPPYNPFYHEAGANNFLTYYYLWYFLEAQAALWTSASSWAVDIALTGLTAFLAICSVCWASLRYSGKASAGWVALAICCAGNFGHFIDYLIGPWLDAHMATRFIFDTWLIQATWVPQHLFSACCALLAVVGLSRALDGAERSTALPAIVGLLCGAAFESSTWVGGFGLLAVLAPFGLIELWSARRNAPKLRRSMTIFLTVGAIAALSACIFLYSQFSLAGGRKLIELWVLPVATSKTNLRADIINVLAYWSILLFLDLGFAYLLTLVSLLNSRKIVAGSPQLERIILIAAFAPLVLAESFQSVIFHNDLAWRAVIIAVFALTIIASRFCVAIVEEGNPRWRIALLVATAVVLMPQIFTNLKFAWSAAVSPSLYGIETADTQAFKLAPEVWQAVREVTPPDEAVANNPDSFAKLTPWPGNIGWALLSDRRNCAAGLEWLRAYAPQLTVERAEQINNFFKNVFAGAITSEDFRTLRETYNCKTILVVPTDGLWNSDILTDNPYYKLAASADGRWRIYR